MRTEASIEEEALSNKQHIVQRQRRGRGTSVGVLKKKSLLAVSTGSTLTTLLVLLGCFLVMSASGFHHAGVVYSFRPPFSTISMRRRFYQHTASKLGASKKSLLQQKQIIVRHHGRHHTPSPSPLRLFASVATSTSADMVPSTTKAKTGRDSASIVELKYMEYLPHDDSLKHHHVPIIFLHGLLGNKKNFATIATSLGHQLKKKRRIIGLDLRNHGDNHHDWRESMNYSEMAQDLLAFLDAHDIPKAVLVGHSMGGKVAQAVALTQPSRVDGLVVLDIAPVAYSNDEPHWKAVQDIVTVLATIPVGPGVTRRDVDIQLRAAIPDPALRAFCLTNFDATRGDWKIHIQAICAQLDAIASFDIVASPPPPTTPPLLNSNGKRMDDIYGQEQLQQQHQYPGDAFFIHGGQSRFVRHAYIPAIQSYFPNHMLTTVRGAGHWIHAEKPEDTIALLKRFLER